MVKISVIVPVYNAENYLRRCVDSILYQKFQNFEVLLIDDGSKDSSAAICDEYAAKESRVHVFHKKNGGVSSARNLGLDYAKGEWICFIDADDILVNDAFSLDWNKVSGELILFSYNILNDDKKSLLCPVHPLKYPKDYHGLLVANEFLMRVVWAKLYKRTSIGSLRFDTSVRFGEDTLFNLICLNQISSVCIISHTFYIYYVGDGEYWNKFSHSIKDSIYSLTAIYKAYKNLHTTEHLFLMHIFYTFKRVCQKDIDKHPAAWFKNDNVKEIFRLIKSVVTWKQRVIYHLLSCTFVSRFNVWLRR